MLYLQLLATLFMTGIIWFVQIVQYPMFCRVGREHFASFHREYSRRITWLVAPGMGLELLSALLCWHWGYGNTELHIFGLPLLLLLWLSTAFVQVPLHNRLAQGFEERWAQLLVLSNWLRTFAWNARSVLVLWAVIESGRPL